MRDDLSVSISKAIVPIKLSITELETRLREVVVNDDNSLKGAVSDLASLKDYRKRIEESRSSLVKPLNDHVKFINGRFKETTEMIDRIELFVKSLISDYRKKQEEARLAAEAEDKKHLHASGLFSEAALQEITIPAETTIRSDSGAKVTFRKVWSWAVTDFAIIPGRYKMLDEQTLRTDIASGLRQIPGLDIYQGEIPAIGGR